MFLMNVFDFYFFSKTGKNENLKKHLLFVFFSTVLREI
jgi:hypothetical protein